MTGRMGWAGVLFDLDGTLADTVELILMSYRHTMSTHLGAPLPDERWTATIGTPLHDQMRAFARDEDEVEAMVETYATFQKAIHDDMVRPFPAAGDVLTTLRERGSHLAVVTSKRGPIARRTLEVCGLWDAVDVVISADEVRRAKPDPEPVVRALDELALGARADEVLFVGDSPFDLRSGRSAGTRTAAALWGPFAKSTLEAERPDFYLEKLTDTLATDPRGLTPPK